MEWDHPQQGHDLEHSTFVDNIWIFVRSYTVYIWGIFREVALCHCEPSSWLGCQLTPPMHQPNKKTGKLQEFWGVLRLFRNGRTGRYAGCFFESNGIYESYTHTQNQTSRSSTHVRLKQMHGANFLSISSNPVFLAQLHPQQWCKNPPKDPSHSIPHVLVQELSIKWVTELQGVPTDGWNISPVSLGQANFDSKSDTVRYHS